MHNTPSPLQHFAITIAGISIEVSSPLTSAELGLNERLGPFFGAPRNPVARVSLRWEASESAPTPRGEVIYDPGSMWKMYRWEQEYFAAITYEDSETAAQPRGVLRANAAWDDLTLIEQHIGASWRSWLNVGAGELLVRTNILLNDGLLFHASGIDDNGRGLVFVGHSGAGKSTHAALWGQIPGAIPMSDDRIAVRGSVTGGTCYGTPWGGTANISRNHQAPLSAIMLLKQAPENEIQALSPAAAAPMLLARAFLPYWDRGLMERALANLNSILARVPVYLLHCRPEMAVIPLVRSVL